MDIICPKCSEPWEMDTLHEIVDEGKFPNFDSAAKDFRLRGCETIGSSHGMVNDPKAKERAAVSSALFDILGDDMDGAAAMMEDFEMFGF